MCVVCVCVCVCVYVYILLRFFEDLVHCLIKIEHSQNVMLQGLALSILRYNKGIILLSWAKYITLIFISRQRNNKVMKKLIVVAYTKHKLLSLASRNNCSIRAHSWSVLKVFYKLLQGACLY